MTDEKYSFISDVKEKNHTARSARSKRTHAGKGGRVRLPSDNLSKKELQKMNGECKSYRLNEPMAWKEFKAMPDDIKITYIKLLRQKFNAPATQIAKMMGVSEATVRKELTLLNLNEGQRIGKKSQWDKKGFYAWWHSVDMLPTPVAEEPAEEPIPEEKETFVEDDLPFEEPELMAVAVHDAEIEDLERRIDELLKRSEELLAVHEKDKQKIAWLENRVNDLELERHILEKQMEVVRMIFWGRGNGN